MDFLNLLLHYMFFPSVEAELGIYYLIWIGVFIGINIFWDMATTKTRPFHIAYLKTKTGILHHDASFCSSLLLLEPVFNTKIWDMAKETHIPLILAGASGMLTSIPAICPYRLDQKGDIVTGDD